MASNLDYLAPDLIPLEEKVNDFLETEKALRRVATEPDHAHNPAQLAEKLQRLEQEIIGMLPTRDEWVKVNLGYGPSRVGAWHVPALEGKPERYELRVVH